MPVFVSKFPYPLYFQKMGILNHRFIDQIDDVAMVAVDLKVIPFNDPNPMAVPQDQQMFLLYLQALDMQSSQT